MDKLLQIYKWLEREIFQDTFKTRKRLFISAFSIYMTVPLRSSLHTFLKNILN